MEGHNNGKMVKLYFLHNQWSDVNHIWQLWSLSSPAPLLYTCTKSWSETTWPNSTKLHAHPTVEVGLKVCSNAHAPSTVMPIYMYGKKIIIVKKKKFFFKTKNCSNDDPFISYNERIGKMLQNICISEVAVSLRWVSLVCFVRQVWKSE